MKYAVVTHENRIRSKKASVLHKSVWSYLASNWVKCLSYVHFSANFYKRRICIFKFYLLYQGYVIFLTFVLLCFWVFFSIKPSERGIIYLTGVKFLRIRGIMGIQHKMQYFQVKTELLQLGPELTTPRETEDPLLSRYIYIHTTLLEVKAMIPFITLCKTHILRKSTPSITEAKT